MIFKIALVCCLWAFLGGMGWAASVRYFGATEFRSSPGYIVACVIFGPISLGMALGGIAYAKRGIK